MLLLLSPYVLWFFQTLVEVSEDPNWTHTITNRMHMNCQLLGTNSWTCQPREVLSWLFATFCLSPGLFNKNDSSHWTLTDLQYDVSSKSQVVETSLLGTNGSDSTHAVKSERNRNSTGQEGTEISSWICSPALFRINADWTVSHLGHCWKSEQWNFLYQAMARAPVPCQVDSETILRCWDSTVRRNGGMPIGL